jgi:hypothetical protein
MRAGGPRRGFIGARTAGVARHVAGGALSSMAGSISRPMTTPGPTCRAMAAVKYPSPQPTSTTAIPGPILRVSTTPLGSGHKARHQSSSGIPVAGKSALCNLRELAFATPGTVEPGRVVTLAFAAFWANPSNVSRRHPARCHCGSSGRLLIRVLRGARLRCKRRHDAPPGRHRALACECQGSAKRVRALGKRCSGACLNAAYGRAPSWPFSWKRIPAYANPTLRRARSVRTSDGSVSSANLAAKRRWPTPTRWRSPRATSPAGG